MGTNYYLHKNVCPTCKRPEEVKHIGKSSVGWAFGLHVYPEDGIDNLEDWTKEFERGQIKNEYHGDIPPAEMVSIITEREHPRGLSRQGIDGRHCVGHGEGTYDFCIGEFS
jgi:hypothetical protein